MNTILSSVIIGGVYASEKTASPFCFSVRAGRIQYMDIVGILVCLSRSRCLFSAECHGPYLMFSIEPFCSGCVMEIDMIHVIIVFR